MSTANVESFYNDLSKNYDQLFNKQERRQYAASFISNLLTRFPSQKAADLACGTGVYALELAKHNLKVTGQDLSADMIEIARNKSTKEELEVDWLVGDMKNFFPEEKLDLIICMGNSLPHLTSMEQLICMFNNVAEALETDGTFVINLLNFEKILKQHDRILSIDTPDVARDFVRFYDFDLPDGCIRFNLLTINRLENTHTINETLLYPWVKFELAESLQEAGFSHITAYGSTGFSEYNEYESDTLLLTARKR